jgi:hypothetical protein
MNVLVPFLREHSDAVDRLAHGERAGLERLIDVIADFEFPFVFDQEISAALARGQPSGGLLAEAYLGVVSTSDWESQVQDAAPAEPPEDNPFRMSEWVTIVRGRESAKSISLPDDDDPRSPRISLFARQSRAPQRVSVEYADGVDFPPSGVAVSPSLGCSLPDWGYCDREECDGACVLTRVVSDPDGLVCYCPHDQT